MEEVEKAGERGEMVGQWPQLVFLHGKENEEQTFCWMKNEKEGGWRVCSVPELCGKRVWTCCHGWLVLSDGGSHSNLSPRPRHFSLFNPITFESIDLPPLLPTYAKECVLSSPPRHPRCAVILLDDFAKCFWVFKLHQKEHQCWSNVSYNHSSVNSLRQPVYCNNKLYAISDTSELVEFTGLDCQLLISLPGPCGYGSLPMGFYLIDLCGDLFAVTSVFQNYELPRTHSLTRIAVYKLNLSALIWEKVTKLRDQQAFFCSPVFAFSCSSSLCSGIRGNHIYFTDYNERCYYTYDIEEETISLSLPCPNLPTPWDHPMWVMPDIRLIKTSVDMNGKEEEGTEDNDESTRHVIGLISQGLNYIARKLNNFVYKNNSCPIIGLKTTPFLLYFQRNRGLFNFVDPENGEKHVVQALIRGNATICHCKNGCLLVCTRTWFGKFRLSLINPFKNDVIQYPDLSLESVNSSLFDFSSQPTNSEGCVVVVLTFSGNEVSVNICYSRKQGWINLKLRSNSICKVENFKSHIYCDGAFYFLEPSGKLGVLSLQEEEGLCKWRVFDESKKPYLTFYQCFLAECGGEIYSVFIHDAGRWVMVFKLDRMAMVWNRVKSLGKNTMYLSRVSTLLIEAQTKENENRIYFPRIYGKENEIVSYSLTTGKFCHFSESEDDYYGSREPLVCCWIRPS